MSRQSVRVPEKEQVPPDEPEAMAQGLAGALGLFLAPLVFQLDRVMEKRLWRTLVQTIIGLRDRIKGLLL